MIGELYGEILVPEAVYIELVHPRGPDVVRERISGSPSWMKVEASSSDAEELSLPEGNPRDIKELDPGEREAILVAVREETSLLLIDERAGRAVARKLGVTVTGTIGVLGAAAQKGLVDPAEAVRDLRESPSSALLRTFGTGATRCWRPPFRFSTNRRRNLRPLAMTLVDNSWRSVMVAVGIALLIGGTALTSTYHDTLGLAEPARDEQIKTFAPSPSSTATSDTFTPATRRRTPTGTRLPSMASGR